MNVEFRRATMEDVPALNALIAFSARELGRNDYTAAQIEAALGSAWGADTQLIRDGTYFVVRAGDCLAACGGWSKRAALFGADARAGAEPGLLDPSTHAARIRAFFVHPQWARQGIARRLLQLCECEARASGFRSAELVATLPGERLYRTAGYLSGERTEYPLPGGETITFVPMRKTPI